jgi:hypothetical protein
MPQPSLGPSELDARLAEIDRRLQEIQAGLAPDIAPPAAESVDAPAGTPPHDDPPPAHASSPRSGPLATLLARTRRRRTDADAEEFATLVQMHNGLLEAVGELVQLLGSRGDDPVAQPGPGGLVSVGPFHDPRQVENFVLTLAALEPVHEATLVGYEGADRALIEVQLSGPSG